MQLIKNGLAIDDPWTYVADDAPVAPGVPPIVSLRRWLDDRGKLSQRNTPIGIRLGAGDAPEEIADDVHRFDVIALEFPTFRDGRAYSSARVLRERLGYEGELRAVGNVLRDQFTFMARCGFDSLEIEKSQDLAVWSKTLAEIGVVYQPTADKKNTASSLRHRNVGIWAF